jgi:hypothetical protein
MRRRGSRKLNLLYYRSAQKRVKSLIWRDFSIYSLFCRKGVALPGAIRYVLPTEFARHGPVAPAKAIRKVIAGWSSPVARQAHNLKAAGSNPAPATI